jgi:hypothetical protein
MLTSSCRRDFSCWSIANDGSTNLLQRIDQFRKWFVGTIFDLIPAESSKVLVRRLCEGRSVLRQVEIHAGAQLPCNVLSLTVFCWAILSSSPSSKLRRESLTLATTVSHEPSNLARSSACWTNASRVPILNSGILKGSTVTLSEATVDCKADSASSLSLVGEMEVGRETSMYLVGLDILPVRIALPLASERYR